MALETTHWSLSPLRLQHEGAGNCIKYNKHKRRSEQAVLDVKESAKLKQTCGLG